MHLLWEQSNSLINIPPHPTSAPLTEHYCRFTKTNEGRYERRHSSFSQAYDQPRWHIKKQRHNFADTGPSSQSYDFSSHHVWMWELSYKENWVPKKKSVLNIHWKDWCWSWNSNPLAIWCGELTHLKRPWCWERLKAGGEGDDRGWDGWMASPTQRTWVWVNFGSWWWTGKPGVLQSMGLQRVRRDWATELNWKPEPLQHH